MTSPAMRRFLESGKAETIRQAVISDHNSVLSVPHNPEEPPSDEELYEAQAAGREARRSFEDITRNPYPRTSRLLAPTPFTEWEHGWLEQDEIERRVK